VTENQGVDPAVDRCASEFGGVASKA